MTAAKFNRRQLISVLAALPFVGKAFAKPEPKLSIEDIGKAFEYFSFSGFSVTPTHMVMNAGMDYDPVTHTLARYDINGKRRVLTILPSRTHDEDTTGPSLF